MPWWRGQDMVRRPIYTDNSSSGLSLYDAINSVAVVDRPSVPERGRPEIPVDQGALPRVFGLPLPPHALAALLNA